MSFLSYAIARVWQRKKELPEKDFRKFVESMDLRFDILKSIVDLLDKEAKEVRVFCG